MGREIDEKKLLKAMKKYGTVQRSPAKMQKFHGSKDHKLIQDAIAVLGVPTLISMAYTVGGLSPLGIVAMLGLGGAELFFAFDLMKRLKGKKAKMMKKLEEVI